MGKRDEKYMRRDCQLVEWYNLVMLIIRVKQIQADTVVSDTNGFIIS